MFLIGWHIFENSQVTSNKMEQKKRHHFLMQFFKWLAEEFWHIGEWFLEVQLGTKWIPQCARAQKIFRKIVPFLLFNFVWGHKCIFKDVDVLPALLRNKNECSLCRNLGRNVIFDAYPQNILSGEVLVAVAPFYFQGWFCCWILLHTLLRGLCCSSQTLSTHTHKNHLTTFWVAGYWAQWSDESAGKREWSQK